MRTALTVRLLQTLLAIAASFIVVYKVLPFFAPQQFLRHLPLYRRLVENIAVMPGAGFAARWQAASLDASGMPVLFPWDEAAPDGDRDAATGLPPVELGVGDRMRLYFWAPTRLDRLTFVLPTLAWAAVALAIVWLLWRMVRTIPSGEVFSGANVLRMMLIGALVTVGATVGQLGTYWLEVGTVARSAAAGVLVVPFSFDMVPLWAGAVIVLLAVVLRQGVRLRQDVEGLV